MSTLVLGAGGFVAKYLVPALVGDKRFGEVTAVGRKPPTFAGAINAACELTDAKAVKTIVDRARPDYVFHLAGSSRVSESTRLPEYHANNLVTTECLCEALLGTTRPVSLFFASSIHVYGNQPKPADEQSLLEPVTAYGFTKYLAEQRLAKTVLESPGLKVVVGRLYSCTGPGQAEGYVVTDLARKIFKFQNGETDHLQVGALSGSRRFLDIRDLPALFTGLIDQAGDTRFNVFNIAPETSHRIEEILNLLLKHVGVSPRIEITPGLAANPLRDLEVDVSKLKAALPNMKLRPLSQTLADLCESLKS